MKLMKVVNFAIVGVMEFINCRQVVLEREGLCNIYELVGVFL